MRVEEASRFFQSSINCQCSERISQSTPTKKTAIGLGFGLKYWKRRCGSEVCGRRPMHQGEVQRVGRRSAAVDLCVEGRCKGEVGGLRLQTYASLVSSPSGSHLNFSLATFGRKIPLSGRHAISRI